MLLYNVLELCHRVRCLPRFSPRAFLLAKLGYFTRLAYSQPSFAGGFQNQ